MKSSRLRTPRHFTCVDARLGGGVADQRISFSVRRSTAWAVVPSTSCTHAAEQVLPQRPELLMSEPWWLAVAHCKQGQWLAENASALESSNTFVDLHGLPLARYRQLLCSRAGSERSAPKPGRNESDEHLAS